jgi:DNA polymerase III alpha subunit
MKADLFKTELEDRVLWFDGTTMISADHILTTNIPFSVVDRITPNVHEYNKYVSKNNELVVKTSCNPLEYTWNIPPSYKTLDVDAFLIERLMSVAGDMSPAQFDVRARRLAEELKLYKKYNLYDVLRTLIYIINTLTTNHAVWGIGRGSSVSSYVLFLIGTHDVDSVTYGLDIADFLHN